MGKAMKVCKVCGKQYVACCTPNKAGVFRWRDVACSPECAEIWLERVMESRAPKGDSTSSAESK